jgi:hypothetical protein
MAAIILGKNLISEDELIDFAFSDDNISNSTVRQLTAQAGEAALHSSWLLLRIMKAERIYISHKPGAHSTPKSKIPPTYE